MSSPEISFRFYESEVPSQEQEKVNSSISKPTETGGAINYARCARVLRRLDSCPGVITASNMSTTQNSATASSICNTREPSWAEDFIDLSEFCQPSTIPTKMEDLVDEHVTSPISSTVRDHGLDFALEVNDRFDNNIGDNLWCIDSPLTLQEELCDPISDWLSTTKETNVYDNLSTRSQLYNINDTLLSPTFTQVPTKNPQHNYGRLEEVDFADNKMPSPPVQPDTTFFHTDSTTVSMFNDCGSRNPTLSQNLFNKPENSLHLTNSSLFADKTTTDTYAFPSQNVRYFDAKKPPDVPALSRVTVDTSVSSPCSVQSPSITQSNLNQEEKTNASGITTRRNVKLKLKVDEPPSAASSCTMDTPEMLQPLVNKNSEFDLVSYVFDDSNKAPMSFDISNLQNSSSNTVRDTTLKTTPLRIKSEPKEDPYAEEETSSNSKRSYDGEERYYPSKRSRKFSNTSSLDLEDLTQLESEKYRELRNRNNEASRRSRANRKNREVEMREHAAHLEAENRRLKVKAEEMEQLVKRLRNCLMQLVLKRR